MDNQVKYTAKELAELELSCLPSTRENILRKAEREGWAYAEVPSAGRFGLKRLYDVPGYVLDEINSRAKIIRPVAASAIEEGADKIANQAGDKFGAKIDPQRLSKAIQLVEAFLADKNMQVSPERKSQVVIVLYNFLKSSHAKEEIDQLLKLVA